MGQGSPPKTGKPADCVRALKAGISKMESVVKSCKDPHLTAFVKHPNDTDKAAILPASIDMLKKDPRKSQLIAGASACSKACNNQPNQALQKTCSDVAGLAMFGGAGMLNIMPFLETNKGSVGFKDRVDKAAVQQNAEIPEDQRGPIQGDAAPTAS